MSTLQEVLNTLEQIDALKKGLKERSNGSIRISCFMYFDELFECKDDFSTPEIFLQTIARLLSILELHDHWDYIFDYIPKKFFTQDFFIKLLDIDSNLFQKLPKTKDLCRYAVEKSGRTLVFVPESMKTQELCFLAVKNDSCAFAYVPDEYKTDELCHIAIKKNGHALAYVPEHLKTPSLCLASLRQDSLFWFGETFYFIPNHMRTMDICVAAVQKSNSVLGDVPPEIVEQVLEAVREAEEKR